MGGGGGWITEHQEGDHIHTKPAYIHSIGDSFDRPEMELRFYRRTRHSTNINNFTSPLIQCKLT